jgi:hypothetical protein
MGAKVNEGFFNRIFAQELLTLVPSMEIRPGLGNLRERHRDAKWYIVSNGSGVETQEVYELLELDFLFDGGIWGSPLSKAELFSRILSPDEGGWFFSDSEEDYLLANKFDLEFFYMSGWNSEKDMAFFKNEGIAPFYSF